jgi:hypothetical protein
MTTTSFHFHPVLLKEKPHMAPPVSLSMHQHIFYCINDFRGPLFTDGEMRIISANIAFLIKHTAGPFFELDTLSIPYIAIRGPNNEEVGRKASVIVHKSNGTLTVVVEVQVEWNGDVMAALTRKVDEFLNEALEAAV